MNFSVQEDLLAMETDFKVIIEFCWNFSLMFRYTVLCLWTPSQVHTGNSVLLFHLHILLMHFLKFKSQTL